MQGNCPVVDGESPACVRSLPDVVDELRRDYALNVVYAIGAHGVVSFDDVESHFPAADTSTLTARLDELVDAGLVTRTQYTEVPPRIEYELTDDGREFRDRLEPMLEWAAERETSD